MKSYYVHGIGYVSIIYKTNTYACVRSWRLMEIFGQQGNPHTPEGQRFGIVHYLPIAQVFPVSFPDVNQVTSSKPQAASDYGFKVGDRVTYIGSRSAMLKSLKGSDLTIHRIDAKDVGCIRDGESHLRFFPPFELRHCLAHAPSDLLDDSDD